MSSFNITPYTPTNGAQRRKIFTLLAQHTSITWMSGAKISPNDLQKIKSNLYLSYSKASGLTFSTAKPQTPRSESKAQEILRSIRADYPPVNPPVNPSDQAQDKPQAGKTAASKASTKAKPRTKKQRRTADNAQQGRLL